MTPPFAALQVLCSGFIRGFSSPALLLDTSLIEMKFVGCKTKTLQQK